MFSTHMCELLLNMVQHKLGRADVKQQLRKMSSLILGQARYLSGVLKSSNTFLFRLYMALLMNSRELQVDGLRCWGGPIDFRHLFSQSPVPVSVCDFINRFKFPCGKSSGNEFQEEIPIHNYVQLCC